MGAHFPPSGGSAKTPLMRTDPISASPTMRTLLAALALKGGWSDHDPTGIIPGDSAYSVVPSGSDVVVGPGLGLIQDQAAPGGGDRAYMAEILAPQTITDLFSTPDPTNPRIDSVIEHVVDLETGNHRIEVVEGTPAPPVQNEIQSFTQTGSPTGGTITFDLWNDANPIVVPFDASEGDIQTLVGALGTVTGGADSFSIEAAGDYANADLDPTTITSNDLTGGTDPSYDIATVQGGSAGPQPPSLPSYSLLLSDVTIPADDADPGDWTFSTDRVVYQAFDFNGGTVRNHVFIQSLPGDGDGGLSVQDDDENQTFGAFPDGTNNDYDAIGFFGSQIIRVDRPTIADQVVTVDPAAFNDLLHALVSLGVVIQG